MTVMLGRRTRSRHSSVFCYSVTAASDPGTLPRLVSVFSQLGMTPDKLYAVNDAPRRGELVTDIQVSGLDADQAHHLANSMRRLIMVDAVLMYEKPADESSLATA